ncbi:unnamed protein product [Linum tenue]|uniref:ascorbate ferrireductase (transmembrane) n=1 Tax=Linum tenue TaxID=586396 RepID=A0AAV0NL28_9ROSI|nr:unnamed protein product [Linum tenue]
MRGLRMSVLPVTVVAHLTAIATTALVLVWLLKLRGGLAWNAQPPASFKVFNVHPLVMVIGFVLVAGEGAGIMAYKTIGGRRRVRKASHLALHLIALFAGVFGVVVVFRYRHQIEAQHMITLHSWLGIITVASFGAAFYMFRGAQMSAKASYLPWHIFVGSIIFLMAVGTALTGIVRQFAILGLGNDQEGHIVNSIGLLLVLFAATVGLTVVLPYEK